MTKPPQQPHRGGMTAWFIWSLSALAFGYAFFQRVAPSVMISDLMAEFSVGAAVLGYLSALYFYPYALLQVPLGALLDRFGARVLLAVTVGFGAFGSLIFAGAETLNMAYLGRFMIGTGAAAGFICSLSLASRWFAPRRFAFLTGLAMFFAMACGIGGQAPLAALVEVVGWRKSMQFAGIFAAVLCVVIIVFVRNGPAQTNGRPRGQPESWSNIGRGLKQSLTNGRVWLIALVAASMSGPMLALGGLWGVPYLMQAYDLARPEAAFFASTMLLGWAAGAPASGWLSDRIGLRKSPVVAASGLCTGLLAAIVLAPGLPLEVTVAIFFLTGAAGATMVNVFAMARETTPGHIHGSVTGIVNGMTVAAGAVLQPVIGVLLDMQWSGELVNGARIYGEDQYRFAFLSLVAWSATGFLTSLLLRETHCKPLERNRI